MRRAPPLPALPWSRTVATLCLAVSLLGGCPKGPGTGTSQAPTATGRRGHRPVEIVLSWPVATDTVRRPVETAGIVGALLESGLADIEDVMARFDRRPSSPGFADALSVGTERWTGSTIIHGDASSLVVMLTLCDGGGTCIEHRAEGVPDAVTSMLAPLFVGAAHTLGRAPLPGAEEAWSRPQSPDPYAVLVAGRGAALYYGALPPLPPEEVGDKKKDPITKAIFLDPAMPLARWIAARRSRELGQSGRSDFARAAVLKPTSLLFAADAAAALLDDGDADAASAAWAEVDRRSPGDPRFAVAQGRAAAGAGRWKDALRALDQLGERLQDDREVVELRVEIADGTGPGPGHDDLLARWQRAAVDDPEPVRRRLALRVASKSYRDALELTEELAVRGARAEATLAAMALAVGLAEWELAAREADSLRLPDVAADLRVRAALELDPATVPPELPADREPEARLVLGGALLQGQEPARALLAADEALKGRPWWPEALALRVDALRKLGRIVEAEECRKRLFHADPAWGQDRAWGNVPVLAGTEG